MQMDKGTLEPGKKRAAELGLSAQYIAPYASGIEWYNAADIHHLLGEGIEVVGTYDRKANHISSTFGQIQAKKDYDKALLIGIRPIVQESEERKLIRDFFRNLVSNGGLSEIEKNLYMRATALLDGGGK